MYYSFNYFLDDEKKTCKRKKNMHLVGEKGLEVHIILVIICIFVEKADQSFVSLQKQCWVSILQQGGTHEASGYSWAASDCPMSTLLQD